MLVEACRCCCALSQIGLLLTHVSYLLTRACHYKEGMIRSGGKDVLEQFENFFFATSFIQYETSFHEECPSLLYEVPSSNQLVANSEQIICRL